MAKLKLLNKFVETTDPAEIKQLKKVGFREVVKKAGKLVNVEDSTKVDASAKRAEVQKELTATKTKLTKAEKQVADLTAQLEAAKGEADKAEPKGK